MKYCLKKLKKALYACHGAHNSIRHNFYTDKFQFFQFPYDVYTLGFVSYFHKACSMNKSKRAEIGPNSMF